MEGGGDNGQRSLGQLSIGLGHFRTFLAVARMGSFTRAAASLRMSQPGLSVIVRQLEDTLGLHLLDRTTRRVILTAQGERFLHTAERAMAAFANAIGEAQEIAGLRRGQVKLGVLPSFATRLIPRVFDTYTQTYPDIGLSLYDGNSLGIQRLVKTGGIDLGVASRSADDADIDFEVVARDHLGVVCREDHPLASARSHTWDALADFPCFGAGADMETGYPLVEWENEVPTCIRSPQYQVFNLVTLGALLAAGKGICVLPRLEVQALGGENFAFAELRDPMIMREVCIVKRRGRSLSPAAEKLRDCVVEQVQRFPPDAPIS